MRSLMTFILVPGTLFISACQTQKINSNSLTDHQQIRLLTDQVLIALATHNYPELKKLLGHKDQYLTGEQAALLLWGSRASVAIIKNWEAQEIQVSVAPDQLEATATGEVFTKKQPNRKLIKTRFSFHFSRRTTNDLWRLQTSSP
jgi:hypothetical protein